MEQIVEKLGEVARRALYFSDDSALSHIEVTPAPEGTGADYASNIAMKLFGQIKSGQTSVNTNDIPDMDNDSIKSPRDLALLFTKIISEDGGFPFSVEVAGPGFINFISRDEYWKQKIVSYTRDFDKNISQDVYSGQQIICEFSDPNPFKVLHVGHLYTSIVGESISRLIEFAGGKVIRANFGGDVGLHVAKTIYALMKKGFTAQDLTEPKDMGKISLCYVDGTRDYEDNDNAKEKITELNRLIYEIADAGPDKVWPEGGYTSDVAALYWAGRTLSYRYFDEFYQRVGVKFDKYYPESTVAKRGLKEVQDHIGPVYEESHGAVIFPGEKYGLHTRVFINNEGLPTYETKDVGLIFTKWDDYHFDKSIIITGNDIIDYMKVVLCSISQFAPDLPARTIHITHGNVRLPGNEKMASRKGNFIKAVDVLDDVEDSLGNLGKTPEMTKISLGAIKYSFLKYKIGGNIEFDIKESVSMTGNSGVYLQYAGVRAKKVLAAVAKNGNTVDATASNISMDSWDLNIYEKSLIRKIDQYKNILEEAVSELAPHKIANYLYDLAQDFSRFYEHSKVVGSNYEIGRSAIVQIYAKILEHGLNILGIEIPEEM
ncbi:arginine--tRNA ligase [Candidatus Saccharibacteria bacterium]|nr:arginine--tRNA ligase [Candidatus Saccharibacteria bacterium]